MCNLLAFFLLRNLAVKTFSLLRFFLLSLAVAFLFLFLFLFYLFFFYLFIFLLTQTHSKNMKLNLVALVFGIVALCCIASVQASIPDSIANAMRAYWGHSTAAGPDGGVDACAWAVNNIVSNAGLRKIGSNTNYVPSLADALRGGRGRAVSRSEAVAGDIAIAHGEGHVGICAAAGCASIDSNSSSQRCFCWGASYDGFTQYFGGEPALFRVEN
jgi:hypothetical protein